MTKMEYANKMERIYELASKRNTVAEIVNAMESLETMVWDWAFETDTYYESLQRVASAKVVELTRCLRQLTKTK